MRLASFLFVSGGTLAIPINNSIINVARDGSHLGITASVNNTMNIAHQVVFESDEAATIAYDKIVNLYTDRGPDNLIVIQGVVDYNLA